MVSPRPSSKRSLSERSESPGSDNEQHDSHEDGPSRDGHAPTRKRQRVRLSCLECRRRKLSCDRGSPCERCIKSGTPERCSYEARNGEVVSVSSGAPNSFSALDSRRLGFSDAQAGFVSRDGELARLDHERIRRLELEIAQLKGMLTRPGAGHADVGSTDAAQKDGDAQQKESSLRACGLNGAQREELEHAVGGIDVTEKGELRFLRGKLFRTRYFGPHNASRAFLELAGMHPFMRESADDWLRPVIIHDRKDRKRRREEREKQFEMRDLELEALLPPKAQVDAMVQTYLDQFEQVHRILHIPTFKKEYDGFWNPRSKTRNAAFTVLILAIVAVASCIYVHHSIKFTGMMSCTRRAAEKKIEACDAWLAKQSQKHRRLIHFQISCLLYLGKRVNTIKKKRFWTGSGALVQDGIAVGLHREPSYMGNKVGVFLAEMRRRIWATMVEFDMQASFDQGLPTLLSQLYIDTDPPRNLDDEDFNEDSTELPPEKDAKDYYTFASFQIHARRSLALRLRLSKVLTGPPNDEDYEQIIRYTNDLTQEIDALPSWDMNAENTKGKKTPLIAYTLLHVQLRQYIIPLHHPYIKLRKQNSKYQYSEIIYYNAARDIVLLHEKLHEQGIRALNFLREDALITAINLCTVTMMQPRGSTNMIMINSQHTLKLIETCIAMKEDRLLQLGNNEPWGYSIMCTAMGLLEAHLGTKTPEAAKSSSAERFINLHYRLLDNQEAPAASNPDKFTTPVGDSTASSVSKDAALEAPTFSILDTLDQFPIPGSASRTKQNVGGFTFADPQPPTVTLDPSSMFDPSNPWMMSSMGDPSQLRTLDPRLELVGMDLSGLWDQTLDLDQMMS